MFALVTLLGLAGLILVLTVHSFQRARKEGEKRNPAAYIGYLGGAVGSGIKNFPGHIFSSTLSFFRNLPCTEFEKWLAAGLTLSFSYLALSGFVFAFLPGRSLFGVFLVLHVMLGGLFALCLTLLALLRARDFVIDIQNDGIPIPLEKVAFKAMFWIFSAAGALLTATALIPMLPLLTHTGQLQAQVLHRYTALAALLSFSAFLYFGIKSQRV